MTGIRGRAAVVTGGSNGIGKGLALALARRGAAIAVTDIDADKAARVAARVVEEGGRAVAIRCDVTDRASIAAMKAEAVAALGPVSLVFANAGATSFQPLAAMSDDDVDWIIQVNLMGVMNTTRAFLSEMIAARNGGHVVATASINGLLPGWSPSHVPYSCAKAGIIGMMMNLALELKPHGIGTTAYCPGGVAGAMLLNNARYRPNRFGGPADGGVEVPKDMAKNQSLKFYTPDRVAPMVLDAVESDRPLVFDHAEQRQIFRDTYASVVEACFDDVETYERAHGTPEANPTGPVLVDED